MYLKNNPKINILVRGNRISMPIKSVINPGTNRKKPPMGVKRVFKKLSAEGSKAFLLLFISSKVLIPLLRRR